MNLYWSEIEALNVLELGKKWRFSKVLSLSFGKKRNMEKEVGSALEIGHILIDYKIWIIRWA